LWPRCRTERLGLRAEKIQAILTSARVPCLAAERKRLQWLVADLLEARLQVHRIERELVGQVKHEPMLLRMAAVGSPHGYPTASRYLKALGLNLKERSSGKHKQDRYITTEMSHIQPPHPAWRPSQTAWDMADQVVNCPFCVLTRSNHRLAESAQSWPMSCVSPAS